MARGKGGLGRGLESLFEDASPIFESDAKVETLPLREIEPDPDQPRKTFDQQALGELAASIAEHGLPENVLELLKSGFINIGHAKVILGLPTPELQEQAAQIIADNQLNVRQAEALCKKLAKPAKEPKEPEPRGTLPVEVEESLKQALGSEVNVAYHGGKGKLTVHFYSDEQLRAFANLLGQYQMETE